MEGVSIRSAKDEIEEIEDEDEEDIEEEEYYDEEIYESEQEDNYTILS